MLVNCDVFSTCVGGVIFGELILHCIPPHIHGMEKAKETCDNGVLPRTEAHYPSEEAQNYAKTTMLDSSSKFL